MTEETAEMPAADLAEQRRRNLERVEEYMRIGLFHLPPRVSAVVFRAIGAYGLAEEMDRVAEREGR